MNTYFNENVKRNQIVSLSPTTSDTQETSRGVLNRYCERRSFFSKVSQVPKDDV